MTVSAAGAGTKLLYGVGALTDAIKTFAFITFLFFYYTTVLGLPAYLLGLAMAVGLVWDAVIDPLIGHISDRVAPPLGRRHFFMLIGAVCAGISFIAVFNPPGGLSTRSLFAWLMISSLCLRSSCSMFMVPYYALGAELATNYDERTTISGYRAAVVLSGTLIATAAAFQVFLPNNEVTGAESKFAAGSYADMGIAFGTAIIIAGVAATLGTLHTRPHLTTDSAAPDQNVTLWKSVTGMLRNRSFRTLVLCSSLSVMGSAINGALAMHFLAYHARISAGASLTFFFSAFYVAALAGVFLWVRAARSIAKHQLYAATTLIAGAIMSSGYWLVGDGRPFGTGNVWVLVAGNGLAGFFGIAPAVIAPSMMVDITAGDEITAGGRRDGTFFGVYSFAHQISTGLAIVIAGVLVDRFAGLIPAQAAQSAQTVERLALTFSVLPAALLGGAAVIALQYRPPEPATRFVRGEFAVAADNPRASA